MRTPLTIEEEQALSALDVLIEATKAKNEGMFGHFKEVQSMGKYILRLDTRGLGTLPASSKILLDHLRTGDVLPYAVHLVIRPQEHIILIN